MTQKIFQTLQRDPRTSPLANNGQARITTLDDENSRIELEGELSTFVCDGQYGRDDCEQHNDTTTAWSQIPTRKTRSMG